MSDTIDQPSISRTAAIAFAIVVMVVMVAIFPMSMILFARADECTPDLDIFTRHGGDIPAATTLMLRHGALIQLVVPVILLATLLALLATRRLKTLLVASFVALLYIGWADAASLQAAIIPWLQVQSIVPPR